MPTSKFGFVVLWYLSRWVGMLFSANAQNELHALL